MSDTSQQHPGPSGSGQYGSSAGQSSSTGAVTRISVADLVAAAGALVTFIFSFLPFFDIAGLEGTPSAWTTDFKGFAAAIPALLALALVVVIALRFANITMPEQVLTFTPDQVKATWGIAAAGIMISFIATGPESIDKAVGFWFMLIGALAMAAGTIMKLLGKGTSTVAVPSTTSSSSASAPNRSQAPGTHPPTGPAPTPPPPPPAGTPPPPPPGV